MIIQKTQSDLLSSNMYCILEGSRSFVIDPVRHFTYKITNKPDFIILTHEHYDHIAGANTWKKQFNIPIICSEQCNIRMQNAKHNMARYYEAFCELQEEWDGTIPADYEPNYTCKADQTISEDTAIVWNGHIIDLMLLPGHSPGSMGILIDNAFFSGDSIFENHETILAFPGGSAKDWEEISIPKIRKLPAHTIIYPGHYDCFTLGKWNQYKIR